VPERVGRHVEEELLQPDSIEADYKPTHRASLASIEIDGEGLLFDEDRGAWHFLNPVAQLIWSFCDGTGSIEEIARDMADAFGEDYDTVVTGVVETVRQLGHQGLLEGVEQTATTAHGHDHEHDHDHDHDEEGGPADANAPRFVPVPPSS